MQGSDQKRVEESFLRYYSLNNKAQLTISKIFLSLFLLSILFMFAVKIGPVITGSSVYLGESLNETVTFEKSIIPLGSVLRVETASETYEKPASIILGDPYEVIDDGTVIFGYNESINFSLDMFEMDLGLGKHTLIVSLAYEDSILDQETLTIDVIMPEDNGSNETELNFTTPVNEALNETDEANETKATDFSALDQGHGILDYETGDKIEAVNGTDVGEKIDDDVNYETYFTFVGVEDDEFKLVFFHDFVSPVLVWIEEDIDYDLSNDVPEPLEPVELTLPLVNGSIPHFTLHVGIDSDIFEFGVMDTDECELVFDSSIDDPGLDKDYECTGDWGIRIEFDNDVFDCNGHTMTSSSGNGIGINVTDRTGVTIQNCTIRRFEDGLLADGSDELIIRNSEFGYNDEHGVSFHDGGNITFSNNEIYNSDSCLSVIDSSDYSLIESNRFYNCKDFATSFIKVKGLEFISNGIYSLFPSATALFIVDGFANVSDNNISGSEIGVNFSGVSGGSGLFKRNRIFNNDLGFKVGAVINDSVAYDNYFYNNTQHAYSENDSMSWNTTLNCSGSKQNILGRDCIGGNYWDNYTGNDPDGDGVGNGELPYMIPGPAGNGDHRPIVPYSCDQSASIKQDLILDKDYYTNQSCFVLNKDGVTLDCDGHSIIGNGSGDFGIDFNDVTSVTLKNCVIKNFSKGVLFNKGSNNKLSDVTLISNDYGVYLDESDSNYIGGEVKVTLSPFGSILESYPILINNTAVSAVYVNDSDDNIFHAFIHNSSIGYHLLDSSDNLLTGNITNTSSFGVQLENSNNNTLGQASWLSTDLGLILEDIAGGIYLINSTLNKLSDVNLYGISSSGSAVLLNQNSDSNNITDLTIINASDGGIVVFGSYQNIFEDIRLDATSNSSILLYNAENNSFKNATVNISLANALYLFNSSINTFESLYVYNTSEHSIYLASSNNNTLKNIGVYDSNSTFLNSSDYNNITNFNSTGSLGKGSLSMSNSDNNYLKNLFMNDTPSGLNVSDSDENIFDDITIRSTVYGAAFISVNDSVISNLEIVNSGPFNLYFSKVFDTIAENLSITGGSWGLYSENSSDNVLSKVNITGPDIAGFGVVNNTNSTFIHFHIIDTSSGVYLENVNGSDFDNFEINVTVQGIYSINSFDNRFTTEIFCDDCTYISALGGNNEFYKPRFIDTSGTNIYNHSILVDLGGNITLIAPWFSAIQDSDMPMIFYSTEHSQSILNLTDTEMNISNFYMSTNTSSERSVVALNTTAIPEFNDTATVELRIPSCDNYSLFYEQGFVTNIFDFDSTVAGNIDSGACAPPAPCNVTGCTDETDYSHINIQTEGFSSYATGAYTLSCGMTLTQDTTITSSDTLLLNNNCPDNGLIIGADDITLDCNGNIITGSGSDYGVEVNGFNNVIVRNCTFANFSTGAFVNNSDNASFFYDNFMNMSSSGISAYDSGSLSIDTITTDNITSHGVYLTNSSNSDLTSIECRLTNIGVTLDSSENITLADLFAVNGSTGLSVDSILRPSSDNITIINYTTPMRLTHSDYGIFENINLMHGTEVYVEDCSYGEFNNISISNCSLGMHMQDHSDYNSILGFDSVNATYALWVEDSAHNNISYMDSSDGAFGIRLSSSNFTYISNMNSSGDDFGIVLEDSLNSTITDVTAVPVDPALSFFGQSSAFASLNSNGTIIDGISSTGGNYTIAFNNSHNNVINDIRSKDAHTYSIFISISNNNNLSMLNITNSTIGIYINDSENNYISNPIITDTRTGINISSSYDNYVTDALISSVNGTFVNGIVLHNSNSINIEDSRIFNSSIYGIYLLSSNDSILTGLNVSYAFEGLHFQSSENNTINDSYLLNNTLGINISSSNNLIYNNYFDNANNTYDMGTNDWNTTQQPGPSIIGGQDIGGNYYSDYSYFDDDNDGIGEENYSIPGGANADHLPLVLGMDNDSDTYPNTIDCDDNNASIIPPITYATQYIDRSVILCNGSYDANIIINASNVNITCSNTTLSGSGTAVRIINQTGVTVKDCIIANYGVGISLEGNSTSNIIYNNSFFNNMLHANASAANNSFGYPPSNETTGNFWDDTNSLLIYDTDNDNYGDSGPDWPYNNTNGGRVEGFVNDYRPWTTKTEEGLPQVNITWPTSHSQIETNFTISFTSVAWDAEDGSLNNTAGWSSGLNGSIGNGTNISVTDLAVGLHTINLTANDSDGNSGNDSIILNITSVGTGVNYAPVTGIIYPIDGLSFIQGTDIPFSGNSTDPEDGSITGNNLTWSSSRDGIIGNGTSFNYSSLSRGTHTIILEAADSEGLATTDNITIIITKKPSAGTGGLTGGGGGGGSTYVPKGPFVMNVVMTEQGTDAVLHNYDNIMLIAGKKSFPFEVVKTGKDIGEVNINGQYISVEVGKQYSVDADNDGAIDFDMELTKMMFGKMFMTFYYVGEKKTVPTLPPAPSPEPSTAEEAAVDEETLEQPAEEEQRATIESILPKSKPPAEESPVSPFFDWKIIAIVALLAVVLITSIAVVVKKAKTRQQLPPSFKHPTAGAIRADPKLIDYVKAHRKGGYADDQIAEHLLKFHTRQQILDAFEAVDMPKIETYIEKYRSKGYSDRQIKEALEEHFPSEEIIDAFK